MLQQLILLSIVYSVYCRHHTNRFHDYSTEFRHGKFVAQFRDDSPYKTYCAPRDELQARNKGMNCMKKCTSNADCQNDRKVCLCDSVCGMSCIRPAKECPELPDPPNGQVHLTGRAFQDRAVYTCDEGHQIIGIEKVVCQASGQWSGEQPTCKHSNGGAHSPYYCSQPPIIKHASHNGSQEQTFFDLDTELSYHCHPGFKREGFDHAKCFYMNGTATWYGPDLICNPIECGPPDLIMHGKSHGDCTSFRCQINYKCDAGFVLDGRATRICQNDGTWTPGELPACRPVQCGIPPNPTNGKSLFTAVAYKSVVVYECNYGFMISGNSTRTCESDKNWSGQIPECIEINCGLPGNGLLPNGYFEGVRGTSLGAQISFKCMEGMVIEAESMSISCGADGKWSNSLPRCLAPCIVPQIQNGNASQIVGFKVSHGNNITVNCTENHEAGGEGGRIECKNGTWSHIPRCGPARCKTLPTPPTNGMIVSPKTTHGAIGLYQCKDGFKLQGKNTTRCEFGTWSGVTPACLELYCQFPGYLTNGRILLVGNMGLYDYRPYVKKITNDRQIMFDCNKGFILSFGSPQGATCIGGTWSPETVPVCVPENHPHIRWLDKRSIRKEVLEKLFPSSLLPSSSPSSSPSPISTPSFRLLSSTPSSSLLSSTSFPISPIRWKENPSEDGNTNLPEDGRAALPEPHLKPLRTNLAYLPRFVENIESKKYLQRALRRVWRRKRNVNELEKNEDITKKMNDNDCSELNAEHVNIDMLKHQAGSNSTQYNADGVTLYVSCKKGFILNSTRNKIECLSGKWKPAIPVCTPLPCTLHQDHMINYRSVATELKDGESVEYECNKGYSSQNSSLQITCTAGALVPTPVCLGDSCTVPKLQNGEYTKGVSAGDRIKHDVLLEYSCISGYQKPTPNPLQCKGGRLIPFEPECIEESNAARAEPLISNMLEEEFCNYSTEEENLVAFLGDRMLSSEDILPEGSKVVFRCSDIGKFKLIGASHLICKSGVLSENVPTCEGLNQQYNYAEELPPTVLFRHENGPIAQSNTGALLVYPKTTLHMECLFQKKNGQPRWIPTNSTKKTYPQGWAQGQMRDSTLEYRLSIYHASSQDSGEYTCTTPLNNSHSIQIQVVALDCPTINLTNGLLSSTTVTRLGTVVRFSCSNGNSLVGAQNLRCLPTGKWNGLIPTCDQITCPDIKTIIKDPVVKITSTENESSGRVYLACPRGFRINGDTRAFCQPNGEWSLNSPSTCKPISCRNPRVSKNLRIHKTGPFNAGDMAKYHCKAGYMLKGKPVAFCSNNGEWSNSSPYCVKACTYPGAAIRGSMDSVKFYYSIGEEVNFKCSTNLTMKGEPRIKCLNSGTWSSEIPVCLE